MLNIILTFKFIRGNSRMNNLKVKENICNRCQKEVKIYAMKNSDCNHVFCAFCFTLFSASCNNCKFKSKPQLQIHDNSSNS